MDESEFQKKVLDGVDAATRTSIEAKTKSEQLLTSVDNLSKETKKALEDLTLVKNHQNDVAKTLEALQKFQILMKRDLRHSFRSPVERIAQDEEKRTRLNLIFRQAANKNGEFAKSIETLRKALNSTDSPGSLGINAELATDLYDALAMYGKWNTLGARRMSTRQQKLVTKTARPVAKVILAGGSRTIADDSNKAGASVTQTAEIIAVLLGVAIETLEDSEFDLTSDILNDFIEAFNYRLDYLAFMGSGASDDTNGGMTGLFEAGTAAAAGNGNTTVETTDLEDWIRCMTVVDSNVLSRSPKWWIHPFNIARACLVRDENGRPLFQTALEAPSYGGIGSIMGAPVIPIEVGTATSAAGDKVAAFGDGNAQAVGVRTDFEFKASDEFAFDEYERTFRGVGRAATINRRAKGFGILTLAAA